jgi:hypothetical protein
MPSRRLTFHKEIQDAVAARERLVLIAVRSLPAQYPARAKRLRNLRDALRANLDRPVVIIRAAARIGVHGESTVPQRGEISCYAEQRSR